MSSYSAFIKDLFIRISLFHCVKKQAEHVFLNVEIAILTIRNFVLSKYFVFHTESILVESNVTAVFNNMRTLKLKAQV